LARIRTLSVFVAVEVGAGCGRDMGEFGGAGRPQWRRSSPLGTVCNPVALTQD
jgi:hypothetical protein